MVWFDPAVVLHLFLQIFSKVAPDSVSAHREDEDCASSSVGSSKGTSLIIGVGLLEE
jgi:hypothetical protein